MIFFFHFCLKGDSLRVDVILLKLLYSYYKWEISNIPLHKIRNTTLWLCFQNNYFWETYTQSNRFSRCTIFWKPTMNKTLVRPSGSLTGFQIDLFSYRQLVSIYKDDFLKPLTNHYCVQLSIWLDAFYISSKGISHKGFSRFKRTVKYLENQHFWMYGHWIWALLQWNLQKNPRIFPISPMYITGAMVGD